MGPAEDSESDVPGEADAEIGCGRGCDARLPAGILGLRVEPEEEEPTAGVDSATVGVLKR